MKSWRNLIGGTDEPIDLQIGHTADGAHMYEPIIEPTYEQIAAVAYQLYTERRVPRKEEDWRDAERIKRHELNPHHHHHHGGGGENPQEENPQTGTPGIITEGPLAGLPDLGPDEEDD